MSNLRLSLACSDYDRTRALRDGRVCPEGIDLIYIPLGAVEIFWRMLQHNEFDISEMSLSNYLSERCKENYRFVGIPVFTSRMFRQGYVFINKKSGIKNASDLKGKKVGLPEYSMTANLFIRGFLQHDYGVSPSDIEWYEGAKEGLRRKNRIEIQLPSNVHIHDAPTDRTLNDMLTNGEIDALIDASIPQCIWEKHPNVDRLWPEYKEVEMDYFRRTKIFPIMHMIVIKREIDEEYPWVVRNLYNAFSNAKKLCQEAIRRSSGAQIYLLPWTITEYQSAVALMGDDYWPYGVEANRATLDAAIQYSYEQGLSSRKLSIGELFAPDTFI